MKRIEGKKGKKGKGERVGSENPCIEDFTVLHDLRDNCYTGDQRKVAVRND